MQIFINTHNAGVKFKLYLKRNETPSINNNDWTLEIGGSDIKDHVIMVPHSETNKVGTYWLAVQILGIGKSFQSVLKCTTCKSV